MGLPENFTMGPANELASPYRRKWPSRPRRGRAGRGRARQGRLRRGRAARNRRFMPTMTTPRFSKASRQRANPAAPGSLAGIWIISTDELRRLAPEPLGDEVPCAIIDPVDVFFRLRCDNVIYPKRQLRRRQII